MANEIQRTESPLACAAALIQQADGKIDVDKLEALLNVQMRWEANEAKKAYVVAMAAFKENPPEILKDRTVSYGQTSYSHASLSNVTTCINKALSIHGLTASWETGQENGKIKVTCKITHVQGHSENTYLDAAPDTSGSKNPIQAIGSTVTYLQRYTLLTLTGLATYDQDDDGAASGESPAAVRPPTDDEWLIIAEVCKAIPAPPGKRVDAKKVAAICYESRQAYPYDIAAVSRIAKWLSEMDRPELFIPENRSDFEIEQNMPGDEDSQPDTEAPSISFKCNACIRTYWYGRTKGFGVQCECGNGTLEESDPRDKAIREAEATAAAKFGRENDQVECRYLCNTCSTEFDKFKIKGVCPNSDCLGKDIIDRKKT